MTYYRKSPRVPRTLYKAICVTALLFLLGGLQLVKNWSRDDTLEGLQDLPPDALEAPAGNVDAGQNSGAASRRLLRKVSLDDDVDVSTEPEQ